VAALGRSESFDKTLAYLKIVEALRNKPPLASLGLELDVSEEVFLACLGRELGPVRQSNFGLPGPRSGRARR
jgi:hypothetical protein